jgi:CPA2 family monovalent cation:H+ antiporter-2
MPILLAESGSSTILSLVIVLVAAALGAILTRPLRLPVIASYLLTGALVGLVFSRVVTPESVESISGIATILLMFTIGLHMDVGSLGGSLVKTLLVGVLSTLAAVLAVWPLLIGGLGVQGGLAVAMALSMSSTAVLVRVLAERRETHKVHGRLIFGTLVVQDLMALAFLATLPLIAAWAGVKPAGAGGGAHGASMMPEAWPAAAKAVGAIVGIALLIYLSRLILPGLLREAGRGTAAEVPLVLSGGVALGSAVIAAGLGFSPELGAFLAGFVLATTPFKHQLSGQLAPMRDLFMAVFFTAVGLKLDLTVMRDSWMIIILMVLALVTVKTLALGLVAWMFGATAAVAALFGLALWQAGEFTIVLLAVTKNLGLIDEQSVSRLIAVVVVSLALTPAVYSLGTWLGPKLAFIPVAGWSSAGKLRKQQKEDEHDKPEGEGHPLADPANPNPIAKYAIIAGFGIVGRSLADRLEVLGVPFCIVDLNQQTIAMQRELKRRAVYGDISNPEVLESAGLSEADAVFLTIPDDEATLRACQRIRILAPHIFIAARTSFLSKAIVATELGADQVIVEEVATAETMARQVLDRLERRAASRK